MDQIAHYKGKGTTTTKTGETFAVEYDLHLWQDYISSRSLGQGDSRIPGLKRWKGTVRPVPPTAFNEASPLTLTLKDGQRLDYFVVDLAGNVRPTGGLMPSEER